MVANIGPPTAVKSKLFDSSLVGTAQQAIDFVTSLLESSTENSVIAMDLDGEILLWNEGARRLYGYEPEEVVGKANSSILHASDDVAAGVPSQIARTTLETGKWEGTLVRRRRNGDHFTARVAVTPRRDVSGKPIGFLLISNDITHDIQLNLALESASMGIWELNLTNDTSIRSLKHDQIFGYQSLQSDWGAEIFFARVVPEDRDNVKKQFEEARVTGKLYFECRIVWPDQSVHWISALGTVFRDSNEKPIMMMGTVQEISGRKRAEEEIRRTNRELRAANKELEAFSYSVSHDLRAPLRSIDGFSQALLEDYADKMDATALEHLQRVRRAAQRMAELIDDMLNLSRVTRCELRREKLDLSAMANSIAKELQEAEPGRSVEFVIESGLTVVGDPQLLRSAMENLIRNSWKYTSGHATARIEFGRTKENGKYSFFVRDDGAGFDPRYAERLFGAFQRLHTAKEFPGTGVGLATVQRIVHRHGGEVWAEGAVEKGATFYFTL